MNDPICWTLGILSVMAIIGSPIILSIQTAFHTKKPKRKP